MNTSPQLWLNQQRKTTLRALC